jgi:hypothetical protein
MGAHPCQFYAAKGLKSGLNGWLRARNWALAKRSRGFLGD